MTNQPTLSSLCHEQSFTFHWVFRIGCLLFLSGLLFSGCGGGGSSTPTATTIATTTATTTPTVLGFATQAYLKAPNAEANDIFGYSVAVSGDTVAVGASFEDSNQTTITNDATASADNSAISAGAVYIFVRP